MKNQNIVIAYKKGRFQIAPCKTTSHNETLHIIRDIKPQLSGQAFNQIPII